MLNVIVAVLIAVIFTALAVAYYYESRINILKAAHAAEKNEVQVAVHNARQEGIIYGIKLCKEAAAEGHPVTAD